MRPQLGKFFGRKLEREVRWEAVTVAFECLVEALGIHSIQSSQIRIEDDPMTANREDQRPQRLVAQRLFHVCRSPVAAVRSQRPDSGKDDMRYAIVIEKGDSNYAAYVPDLPGCVAAGDTVEETRREIQEAIAFHLEGLRADGLPVPEPTSRVQYIEVAT